MNPLLAMLQQPGLDSQLGQTPQGLHWGSYATYPSLGYENLPNYTMPNLSGDVQDMGFELQPSSFDMSGQRNPAQLQSFYGGRGIEFPRPDETPPGTYDNYHYMPDPEVQTRLYDMPMDQDPRMSLSAPWSNYWNNNGPANPQTMRMMQPGGPGTIPGQAQMGQAPGPTYPVFSALLKMLGLGG